MASVIRCWVKHTLADTSSAFHPPFPSPLWWRVEEGFFFPLEGITQTMLFLILVSRIGPLLEHFGVELVIPPQQLFPSLPKRRVLPPPFSPRSDASLQELAHGASSPNRFFFFLPRDFPSPPSAQKKAHPVAGVISTNTFSRPLIKLLPFPSSQKTPRGQ